MAEKKIYIGSVGPLLYDDTDDINDADGDFSGESYKGLMTDGDIGAEGSGVIGGDLTVTGAIDVGSIETGEILLTPKTSSSGVEGTIYYDSDDDHVYVATE